MLKNISTNKADLYWFFVNLKEIEYALAQNETLTKPAINSIEKDIVNAQKCLDSACLNSDNSALLSANNLLDYAKGIINKSNNKYTSSGYVNLLTKFEENYSKSIEGPFDDTKKIQELSKETGIGVRFYLGL